MQSGNVNEEVEVCDAEILDELTTNRGEIKVRTGSSNEEKHIQVKNRNLFFLWTCIHKHYV